jgi:hypothetical protein
MTTDNLQHVENYMLLLGKTSRERLAAFFQEINGRLTAAGVEPLPMGRHDTNHKSCHTRFLT